MIENPVDRAQHHLPLKALVVTLIQQKGPHGSVRKPRPPRLVKLLVLPMLNRSVHQVKDAMKRMYLCVPSIAERLTMGEPALEPSRQASMQPVVQYTRHRSH